MTRPNYKVRFASTQLVGCTAASSEITSHTRNHWVSRKSRDGCRECKRRRVKCDEQFPMCLRCQRRGTVCTMDPKKTTWQPELPGVTMVRVPDHNMSLGSHVDSRLLRLWLERTSQVMVLDPDINPLSFPILSLLTACPWLASVLQSISAAHEYSFDPERSRTCLVERGRALRALARQVTYDDQPLVPMLLGAFLLGVSSCWIEADPCQFGAEHLLGARAVFDLIIAGDKEKRGQMEWFAIGTYVYWDMSCSLLFDPAKQKPLNSPEIHAAVLETGQSYHPMAGSAIELYYHLATLGRYCRSVISYGIRDFGLEDTIEEQVLQWQPSVECEDQELVSLSEAFRYHGLILLYRICGVRLPFVNDFMEGFLDQEAADRLIHQLALKAFDALASIPVSSSRISMQPIPLLTIGSELWEEDESQRQEVTRRFKALLSVNRTPVNRWAIVILEEVWEARRIGLRTSWVECMLCRHWAFTLG